MTEGWLKAINEGKSGGTIMVDFRKAFDPVDHDLLLKKLSYYKCESNFINLMKSYLKNRTQVVSMNGTKSNTAEISSGVPHGSILGPLLLFIFINYLPLVLSGKVSSIWYVLWWHNYLWYHSTSRYGNTKNLFTRVTYNSAKNGDAIKYRKDKVMLISTRQKRIRLDIRLLSLTYNGIDLQLTTWDKILGVYIDENFQWLYFSGIITFNMLAKKFPPIFGFCLE